MYALQGNSCNQATQALTSNHKYLPPGDQLYFKPFTSMYKYPARMTFSSVVNHSNDVIRHKIENTTVSKKLPEVKAKIDDGNETQENYKEPSDPYQSEELQQCSCMST